MLTQARHRLLRRRLALRRHHQHLPWPRSIRRSNLRPLLQHHVRVRPPDPERAHSRSPRSLRPPRTQTVVHEERAVRKIYLRVRLLVVKARRQLPVLKGQNRLDQTRHPRPAAPAAASRCPTFVFSEPNAQKPFLFVPVRNTWLSASISIGSPSVVPVPCASTYPIVSGSTSATAWATAITCACPDTPGAV